MTKPLRIGVVGAGEQSVKHILPSIIQTSGANVTAICDVRQERANFASTLFNIPAVYRDHLTMFDDAGLDAVFVVAYPVAHEEIAIGAMHRNLPVFVEKPPAVDSEGLMKMIEVEKCFDRTTGVGMNFRFSDSILEIARAIREEYFGRLSYVSLSYFARAQDRRLWGIDSLAREFLLAQAIHPIDLLLWLGGSINESNFSHVKQNGVLICETQVGFTSGAIGRAAVGVGVPKFTFELTVITQRGVHITINSLWEVKIIGGNTTHPIFQDSGRWSEVWTPTPLSSGYSRAGYSNAVAGFIASINDGTLFLPRFRDLFETYRLLEQLEAHLPGDLFGLSIGEQ